MVSAWLTECDIVCILRGPHMSRFCLFRIKPERRAWRFYAASLQPTLFGPFVLCGSGAGSARPAGP